MSKNKKVFQIDRNISKKDADKLRKDAIALGQTANASNRAMGSCLYAIKVSTLEEIPLFEHWGYTSFFRYLCAELDPLVSAAHLREVTNIHECFEVRYPEARERARGVGHTHLRTIISLNLARLNRAESLAMLDKWLAFAEGHTREDTSVAVASAKRLKLEHDPERAFALAGKKPSSHVSKTARLFKDLKPEDRDVIDWAVRHAHKILRKKGSDSQALAAVLRQFKNLARRGEAGTGWNDTEVVLNHAAE